MHVGEAGVHLERFLPAPEAARDRRPVVLVHGGSANASWWAPMVAALMTERPVGTVDLSGHGRSDWRSSYSFDTWVEEVTAAAEYLFPERRGACRPLPWRRPRVRRRWDWPPSSDSHPP